MTEIIQIGIIGTSWWADLAHLPYFTADSRVKVVAICGRNRERAQEMATKYNIAQVFTDYREMIAKGDLQAVAILTPDDEHFAMTMAAIDAGLHVLCEKPLAGNADHAKQMLEAAEAKNVRHMTYFTWRWLPLYRYLHDLIAQGVLGRIYQAQFNFIASNGRNPNYAWRFDPQRSSGAIADYGSHMIDLAHFLVGEIVRVKGRLTVNLPRNGLDGKPMASACDAATLLVEFANGAHGTIEVSAVARTHDPALEHTIVLHGEAGSLTASFGLFSTPPKIELASGDNGFQHLAIPDDYLQGLDPAQPVGPQMQTLFSQPAVGGRGFVEAILTEKTVAPSFHEGWQTQRVIDAVLASHKTSNWMEVR